MDFTSTILFKERGQRGNTIKLIFVSITTKFLMLLCFITDSVIITVNNATSRNLVVNFRGFTIHRLKNHG